MKYRFGGVRALEEAAMCSRIDEVIAAVRFISCRREIQCRLL